MTVTRNLVRRFLRGIPHVTIFQTIFFALMTAMCGASIASAQVAGEAFNLHEVAPGVFVHLGKPLALDAPGHDDIANIGFIVGKNCIAVIDTGGSLRIGRALRAALRRRSTLPICYVINTHGHVDHVLGNAAFRDDQPRFVGHSALPADIARSRAFFLEHYADDFDRPASAAQVIAPDRTVATMLDLDLGKRILHLRAWPNAHSDADLTVLDAVTGTLWSGDLLFRERLPALDGSVKGWLAVIDELAHLQVSVTVPGHGAPSRDLRADLQIERHYLQALLDAVRAAIAQGKSMNDAMLNIALSEKPHWLLWDSTHPHNVARAYQELEWE